MGEQPPQKKGQVIPDEVMQRALAVAEDEKNRILEKLHDKKLNIEFGRTWRESRVTVAGEELPVFGIALNVDGGDETRIELRVRGQRLAKTFVVTGRLEVFGVEFEDEEEAMGKIVAAEMRKDS